METGYVCIKKCGFFCSTSHLSVLPVVYGKPRCTFCGSLMVASSVPMQPAAPAQVPAQEATQEAVKEATQEAVKGCTCCRCKKDTCPCIAKDVTCTNICACHMIMKENCTNIKATGSTLYLQELFNYPIWSSPIHEEPPPNRNQKKRVRNKPTRSTGCKCQGCDIGRCRCRRDGFACTDLCNCGSSCNLRNKSTDDEDRYEQEHNEAAAPAI
ncbi:hypothetical protein ACFE04_022319 [Oxalis oulophora]